MFDTRAFIADHVEVNPSTGSLDLQAAYKNYVDLASLPSTHVLGLGIVAKIGCQGLGCDFTIDISVDRVEDGANLHHSQIGFAIPEGSQAVDWTTSRAYPFAASLATKFHDVGHHGVTLLDGDRMLAYVPLVVRMAQLVRE